MNLLPLYLFALTQKADKARLSQFKSPALPSCEYHRTLLIAPQHYQRYCRLINWPAEQALHPCYLQMVSLPLQLKCLTTATSPFPVLGLVHRANQITLVDTIDNHAEIQLLASYADVRPHKRGWEVDLKVKAKQDKRVVYEAVSRYLVRVKAPHVAPAKPAKQTYQWALPAQATEHAAIVATRNIGRQYARVSGDYNPIHLSRVSASAFGFSRAIAHGMWSLASMLSHLPDWQHAAGTAIQCEFIKPLRLPGTARCFSQAQAGQQQFWLTDNKLSAPHISGVIQTGA